MKGKGKMKLKKTMTTLIALVMSAGMILPQTVSPFGSVLVYAEEAVSTDETVSASTSGEEDATISLMASEEDATSTEESETTDVTKVTTEDELTAALAAASTDADNPTVIELQNDISLTGYLTITAGTYVEIQSADGEQFTLKAGDDTSATAYWQKRNYSGVLYVCGSLMLKNVICDANDLTRGADVSSGGVLELDEGAVLTNGNPTYVSGSKAVYSMGGGAYVFAGGTLIMYKGSAVRDNTVSRSSAGAGTPYGVGVYIEGASSSSHGRFYMYGGTISNNDWIGTSCVSRGGGVCLGNYVEFYMYGGTISGNDITGSGAGIYANNRSTVVVGRTESTEIDDLSVCDDTVVISNNTITDDVGTSAGTGSMPQGAGIAVLGTLTIQAIDDGDTVISGNTVYSNTYKYPETTGSGVPTPSYRGCGGGIFVTGSYADVTMTGGTITGNQAICEYGPTEEDDEDLAAYHYANGGGVYVQEGTFTMTGGQITGNSASSAWTDNPYAGVGGGLCVGFNAGSSDVKVTLTGGTISGNTAAAGSDVYLTNAIPSYQGGNSGPGGTTYSDGYVLYSASDLLYVGGSVKIGEIYLPADVEEPYNTEADGQAVIHMVSALTNTNAIGVTAEDPQVGTVVVESEEDGYAIGYADEIAFYCAEDDSSYEIRLDSDGNLSLQTQTTTTYLARASVTLAEEDQTLTYTGAKLKPEPTVTLNGETLEKGTDYMLTYSDNVDVGTATVTVNGIGSYTGSATATFTIEPLDISTSDDVTVAAITDRAYTGEAQEPTVTVYYNDETLTQGDTDSEDDYDYSVAYTNNVERGVATVTITGHGNFTGTREAGFNIIDTEGTTLVSDGATLERVIEAAAGTTADNPLIISLTADVTLEVTEAEEEADETEETESADDSDASETTDESTAATDAMITLPENTYVQIIGYGYTITVETDCFATENVSETGMFIVPNGSELTLDSMTLDGQYHERLLYVMDGGNAAVSDDVTLTRGRATEITSGSDAAIEGGQAIWNAGSIIFEGSLSTNRTSANYYGAVYNAADGTFTMTETARIENVYVHTGAVYNAGTFTMDGGVITDTTLVVAAAGASAVYNVGTFTMKDGSAITENTVFGSTVYNTGTFLMEGGEISDNEMSSLTAATYQMGTIQMVDGSFYMTGGSISGNKVANKGGGFYIVDGVVTINGEDAEISGNSAVNAVTDQGSGTAIGGGIYMRGGELNILCGSIDNNEAYFSGTQDRYKQARLGQLYSLDGTYSIVTSSNSSNTYQYYGLGGGIFVDSGTLTIGDGAVIEDNYCPIESASGVVIAEDLVNTVEDYASQIYLSGSPQISDTIYLDEGKSILINGALGDGDETYQVYQQETDFKLVENGGTAAARYTDENYMNEDDGDKFTVYPYDAEWDFEADTTLDHYTALSSAVTGSSAGIYANYAAIDLSEISYEFTDAYSTDEDGTAQYKYNGFTRKPTIQATAEIGTEDDAEVIDVTSYLTFIYDDAVSAGDYTVTVTSDSYHITDTSGEGYALTFRIMPVDLSDPGEASDRWQVEVEAEDVAYDTAYPEGELTETTVTAQVRLGTVNWTELVQADSADSETGDYYVTWENNDQAGTATAVIHGINNYTGEVSVTFEITAVEEDNADADTGTDTDADTGAESAADSLAVRRGNIMYYSYTIHAGDADYSTSYGKSDDVILVGDWDGDGVDTICVRRGNQYIFSNNITNPAVRRLFITARLRMRFWLATGTATVKTPWRYAAEIHIISATRFMAEMRTK